MSGERFKPGWARPLDPAWVATVGQYFERRGDVARAYAVTTTYLELDAGPSQEELMIELVDPPSESAPSELFSEVGIEIPKHPTEDLRAGRPIRSLSFTFTPRRLVDEVRANGQLVWERRA